MLRKRKNRRGPKHTGLTTLAVSQKVTRVEYDTTAWSELQYIVSPMLTSISNRQVEGDRILTIVSSPSLTTTNRRLKQKSLGQR